MKMPGLALAQPCLTVCAPDGQRRQARRVVSRQMLGRKVPEREVPRGRSKYDVLPAMSGLPVIVTPNVGAIIAGDDAGQIVPVRDAPVIARALSRYRDEPDLLAQHRAGALALRDAASTERYGRDLVALVRGI